MNKYQLTYQLETMTSTVDRLSDVLGKQSHHISELWEEIGIKQNLINNQSTEIRRLKDMNDRYRRKLYVEKVDQAKFEKSFKEWTGESVDN